MKTASFIVDSNVCVECAIAVRRFIGGLKGVSSIYVEDGKIIVSFNENEIDQDRLSNITRDSLRKMGYDIEEEQW